MAESDLRIGFLGAGKMATALARGWLHAGLVTADGLVASDPVPQARAQFAQNTGSTSVENNATVVQRSQLIILAVKPQNMAALVAEIRPVVNAQHLVISI